MKPNSLILKYFSLLVIVLLFGQGCVEHIFFITISPSGRYTIRYDGKGDQEDLTNSDFPVPKSTDWDITSNFVEVDNTFIFSSQKEFDKNEKIPDSFFTGDTISNSALLKHPMSIVSHNYFFFTTYKFNCFFENRDVTSRYPKLSDFIQNPDDPPDGWIKDVFSSLLFLTLDASNPGFNKVPIVKNELGSWLKSSILTIEDSTLFSNLDFYRSEGLDILKSGISPNKTDVDSIFNGFETEADITLDLMDDQFNYQVILPGILREFNADSLAGDTLYWNFSLSEFLDVDKVLTANSYIIHKDRLIISLIIVFFLLFIFLKIQFKKA